VHKLFGSNFGLAVKLLFLSSFTALFTWMAYLAILKSEWAIAVVLIAIILSANYIYMSKKPVAGKFLLPGVVFLILFMIVPVIYTTYMSGFIYKAGNIITKQEAIHQILTNTGMQPDENNTTYDMVLGTVGTQYTAIFTDQTSHQVYLGQNGVAKPLTTGQYHLSADGIADSVPGFKPYSDAQLATADQQIADTKDSLGNNRYILAQDAQTAALFIQTLTYNAKTNTLLNPVDGTVYVDGGKGYFVNKVDSTQRILPGWRQPTWLSNYTSIFTNAKLRDPFIKVFLWTFAFAFITVIMMFGFGLILAIALDKKIRFRNFYRALLILPYAMPSFMSILIWAGMLNRDYGSVNTLLGHHIDWLGQVWLARAAVLIVNLWLGFPYFYLISTGAIQALPGDLEEAAAIDGASGPQIFWRIKLPLVLQILSPMLIASFAFNFNNFNLVYLLTRGGPTNVLGGETAGGTDLLITYAYKTAFATNDQNYGLASAISVVVFVIVGAISMWSLRRSKVLEDMR